MWQCIISLQKDSIAVQIKWFYLLGKGGFHTIFNPEEGSASLERRWFSVMTKLKIKEAIGRTSF